MKGADLVRRGRRAGRADRAHRRSVKRGKIPFSLVSTRGVERVELLLRRLIADRIDGEPALVPSHVRQRVEERVATAARKLPEESAAKLATLDVQLEYFDLRELQDVIASKALWPRFESTFRTKEALAVRFGQLAELRNAIRHSRTLTDLVIKDGEAAILWFSSMLEA